MTIPRNADQLWWANGPRRTDSNATTRWSGRTAATSSESGSGSTSTIWGPGANAPSGVTWAYISYDGYLFPATAAAHPGTSGSTAQMGKLTTPHASIFTESDSTNPTGTGSHLVYRYPGASSGTSYMFMYLGYTDYGGQAPSKFQMASFNTSLATQSYRTLYMRFNIEVRHMRAFGFGSATTGHESSSVTTLTAASGSGRTFIYIGATGNMTNDAYRGMQARFAGGTKGYPIESNTTTRLFYESGWQNDYNLNGETFSVRTYAYNSTASGWNAGVKWFFLNHGGLESVSTGSAYGSVWTLPSAGTLWINNTNLNDYVGLWDGYADTAASEGFHIIPALQQQTIWNGGLDANGVPNMAETNFDIRPNITTKQSITTSEFHDIEVIAYLNDSYDTNGRFFLFSDGALIQSSTTLAWTPKGFRMSKTTTVAGNTFEVYSRATQPRWVSVRYDPTFGGGLRTPGDDYDIVYRAWYIGGVPATGND